MSPEQQRIAIAEVCGWTWELVPSNEEREDARLGRGAYTGMAGYPESKWWKDPSGKFGTPPDYINDLNAMHETEKTLSNKEFRDIGNFTETERSKYCSILEHVVTSAPKWSVFECYNATAAQRAEAFLKIKGKWKE